MRNIKIRDVAEIYPTVFFERNLHKQYPEFEMIAAERMLERIPYFSHYALCFFEYNLHKRYPKLILNIGYINEY